MNKACDPIPNVGIPSFPPAIPHLTDFNSHGHAPLTGVLQLSPASSGSAVDWGEFIRRIHPVIAGVVSKTARLWTKPTFFLVEDLVQETYLKLFANDCKALREFDCEHNNALYGFLKVVASNVVHDYFRSAYSQKRGCGREKENLEHVPVSMAFCRHSLEEADRCILLDEIDDCLADRAGDPTFSRDYAIFWLYYREGLTAKAIADLPSVGLTVKGVESVVGRLTRYVRLRLNRPSAPPISANFRCH